MQSKRTDPSKKQFKLPFSALLSYLILTALLLSGVTFSKYVAGTAVGEGARVAYIKDITVTETGNFSGQNSWIITPGVDIVKNAAVHFEGSEMACYVFLKIKTTGWENDGGDRSFSYKTDGTTALSWQVTEDWDFLEGTKNERIYYRIVAANTVLDLPVIANGGVIEVSDSLTKTQLENMKNASIDIGATAVQYYGFSEDSGYTESQRARAVWNTVKDR